MHIDLLSLAVGAVLGAAVLAAFRQLKLKPKARPPQTPEYETVWNDEFYFMRRAKELGCTSAAFRQVRESDKYGSHTRVYLWVEAVLNDKTVLCLKRLVGDYPVDPMPGTVGFDRFKEAVPRLDRDAQLLGEKLVEAVRTGESFNQAPLASVRQIGS